jgi:LuxR family maltose regulon positive regulatory protein
VTEGPDIPLARATSEVARGRLDEAAAHLTVAEASIAATPADRRHRLEVATAALRLSLARKRGHLAGVVEQVRFLASPVTGQSDEDIALDSDLRAVALMNLGIVEAWSLGNQDSERHLLQGAELARRIGRPYLEVACLAELAFAAKIEPFATTRRRCLEAIALAEQHGWGAEPVISPALVNLAGVLIWTGEFDEGERWLRRTARALETDSGFLIRLLLHIGTGMLMSGRRRQQEALAEYRAAERLQAKLEGSHALAGQLTSFRLATQLASGRSVRPGRRWQHWTTAWPARARSVMPGRPSASPRATRTLLSRGARCPGRHGASHRLHDRRRGKPAGGARASRTRRSARCHRGHRERTGPVGGGPACPAVRGNRHT